MSINNTIIYVALLIVPLLPLESTAEGVELSQSFYSPKFALQTEKTALCNKVFWLDEEAEQESNKISKRPKAGLGIYTAEFLAATVDGAVGLIVGSCGALGCFSCIVVASESLDESGLAYLGLFAMVAGAAVGAPMGAAYGVTYKGKQLEQGGSFWGALAGSVLGTVVTAAAVRVSPSFGVMTALAIPLGAVIGYNLWSAARMGSG